MMCWSNSGCDMLFAWSSDRNVDVPAQGNCEVSLHPGYSPLKVWRKVDWRCLSWLKTTQSSLYILREPRIRGR